jgi:hypothetical protein
MYRRFVELIRHNDLAAVTLALIMLVLFYQIGKIICMLG